MRAQDTHQDENRQAGEGYGPPHYSRLVDLEVTDVVNGLLARAEVKQNGVF